MKLSLRALVLLACAILPLAAMADPGKPLPISSFFKRADTTGALLSPSGRFVAVRKRSPQGRTMLTIFDVMARTSTPLVNFTNADVDVFYWLNDQRLAFSLINLDHDGDIGKPGLYAIDRDGKSRTYLSNTVVPKRSFSKSDVVERGDASPFCGFPFDQGESILVVSRYVEDNPNLTELVRVNTRTGKIYRVGAPAGAERWLVDADGKLRIATVKRGQRNITFFLTKHDWRQIDARDENSEQRFEPVLYVDDQLYVRSRNGKDESSIYRYDLATNAMAPTPLVSIPGYDADGSFILSERKMLGFRSVTEADTTIWFDERMKAIQQEVDRLQPGMTNDLSIARASETPYVLIDNFSDIENHAYILYNTETKEQLLLGETTPDLPADKMAHMSMVRYKGRDGLPIPAFLTLPNGRVQKNLPTVLLLGEHRDLRNASRQWNAEVQFLASRGYAVLQPQPRGVRGFGRAHFSAGSTQLDRTMQEDIVDAVKWAVAQGHTDPTRVCIAGSGHGGYASMMALLKDADMFKCGISWSGPTTDRSNPDAARLKEIKRPLLLAYGADDDVEEYKQGLALYKALKAADAQAEWLEYTSTVDDWKTQKNRIDLWQHIESFLAKQIGIQ